MKSIQRCVFSNPMSYDRITNSGNRGYDKRDSRNDCSTIFLKCSICGKRACAKCLKMILDASKDYADEWCDDVLYFLEKGVVPRDFIGHCCEWRLSIAEDKFESIVQQEKNRVPMRYDGYIYYPEFELLCNSPFDTIDVHGLASADTQNNGVWHCVPSRESCIRYKKNNIYSKKWDLDSMTTTHLTVRLPYGRSRNVHFKVEAITLDQSKTFHKSMKGTNDPSDDEIASATVYDGEKGVDVDITLIIGRKNQLDNMNKEDNILLFRFHTTFKHVFQSMTNTSIKCLYDELIGYISKGGYESRRFGGSSGETIPCVDLLRFVNVHNTLPARGGSVKIIKRRLKYKCL